MFVSAMDRVLQEIECQIIDGSLEPGAPLDEADLSRKFQVSRTPVREALLHLSALGYVRIIQRAGIHVVKLSPKDLNSMLEVLAHTEGLCAKLVISRINDEQINMLRQLHKVGKAAVDSGDLQAYSDYNNAFHEALYRCCGNAYVVDQVIYLRKRLNPYRIRNKEGHTADRIAQSWQEHDDLLAAVLAKDETAAMQHASHHIISGRKDLFDLTDAAAAAHLVFDSDSCRGSMHTTVRMPSRMRISEHDNLLDQRDGCATAVGVPSVTA